ncbi:putative Ankyrin repeat family protein [Melia azedarach]|uniref:Ankyrin repeat family protein n=1 Tax=Melia azedarach TaxID=155640 RepID=A0ACC1YZ20_MELAZ|nr:putative Ankyrin repeat family protein [Melia azedarach]
MDRRLFEAALTGDVQKLYQLLGENPLILHTYALASAGNPLYIASAYGHIDFVKEIVGLKPDLTKEVNQDGFSPMHMASANGQIEVVRELMNVDRKPCHLQGPEKKTPLHCAAIKGRVNVVSEMLSAFGECVEDVTVQRETALHLAVKNNQFEAIRDMKKENILNMKDEHGNTVIELSLGHEAIASGGLEVNATNQSGLTALDVLLIFPSEAGDREIEEILQSAGAMRMKDVNPSPIPSPEPYHQTSVNSPATAETNRQQPNDLVEYLKFKKGRFSRNNSTSGSKAHDPGISIWASVDAVAYGIFMFFNTVGFSLAIHMMYILTTKFPLQLELLLCFLAMVGTYNTAAIHRARGTMQIFISVIVGMVPVFVSLTTNLLRQRRKRRLMQLTTDP